MAVHVLQRAHGTRPELLTVEAEGGDVAVREAREDALAIGRHRRSSVARIRLNVRWFILGAQFVLDALRPYHRAGLRVESVDLASVLGCARKKDAALPDNR